MNKLLLIIFFVFFQSIVFSKKHLHCLPKF